MNTWWYFYSMARVFRSCLIAYFMFEFVGFYCSFPFLHWYKYVWKLAYGWNKCCYIHCQTANGILMTRDIPTAVFIGHGQIVIVHRVWDFMLQQYLFLSQFWVRCIVCTTVSMYKVRKEPASEINEVQPYSYRIYQTVFSMRLHYSQGKAQRNNVGRRRQGTGETHLVQ